MSGSNRRSTQPPSPALGHAHGDHGEACPFVSLPDMRSDPVENLPIVSVKPILGACSYSISLTIRSRSWPEMFTRLRFHAQGLRQLPGEWIRNYLIYYPHILTACTQNHKITTARKIGFDFLQTYSNPFNQRDSLQNSPNREKASGFLTSNGATSGQLQLSAPTYSRRATLCGSNFSQSIRKWAVVSLPPPQSQAVMRFQARASQRFSPSTTDEIVTRIAERGSVYVVERENRCGVRARNRITEAPLSVSPSDAKRARKSPWPVSTCAFNIYSVRYICYRFWAFAVSIGTQPCKHC